MPHWSGGRCNKLRAAFGTKLPHDDRAAGQTEAPARDSLCHSGGNIPFYVIRAATARTMAAKKFTHAHGVGDLTQLSSENKKNNLMAAEEKCLFSKKALCAKKNIPTDHSWWHSHAKSEIYLFFFLPLHTRQLSVWWRKLSEAQREEYERKQKGPAHHLLVEGGTMASSLPDVLINWTKRLIMQIVPPQETLQHNKRKSESSRWWMLGSQQFVRMWTFHFLWGAHSSLKKRKKGST